MTNKEKELAQDYLERFNQQLKKHKEDFATTEQKAVLMANIDEEMANCSKKFREALKMTVYLALTD